MGKKEKEEVKDDPSLLTFYPPKYFLWEKIKANFDKEGMLKKKAKSGKKFNQRYVCLYYNYLLWYTPGKGPNGAPHERSASAKGIIELERVGDPFKVEQVQDKTFPEGCFSLKTSKEEFMFQCDNYEQAQEWVKAIRSWLERAQVLPKRESFNDTLKRLQECQQTFPESFKPPTSVTADQSAKWVSDIKRFREEYKRWLPFINSLTLYAETNIGRPKGYSNWFLNKTKGVFETINNSEESVLADWAATITKAPADLEAITETMFYMEDIAPQIEKFEKVYSLVDIYNNVKREFQMDDQYQFEEEKQAIRAWIDKLGTYPNAKDVSVEEWGNGTITTGEMKVPWDYTKSNYTVTWTTTDGEPIEFTCLDHHFTFVNPMYGSILWNYKSVIWTHPHCPYIIRYDYFANKGVFKQRMPNKNANPAPGAKKAKDPPALSDWQYADGVLRAVTVGQRDPEPEIPPYTEWLIDGNPPPSVVLLAGIFYKIREIMREILGLNQLFIPTGLNPIF